ncbi:hypothetical protein PybrP1_001252 [[Pythium] brassicae (nom. inval.)]|nr:hypothetical protein PybrP1_001252 [[Pythium] brassicae (nom. inval.)]
MAKACAARTTLAADMPAWGELILEHHAFRAVWLFVVALHCLCAVYLAQLVRVFKVIAHPHLEALVVVVLEDRLRYLPPARAVAAVLSALHWWQLLAILRSSVRARELVLEDPDSSLTIRVFGSSEDRTSSRSESMSDSKATTVASCPVFGAVFTIRELAKIASQSFQARRASEFLSRSWLNHVLVVLVVVNCWSTPAVQRSLGHRRGTERVVRLFIDAMVNVGSSMAVPLAIFLPYYSELSPATLTFPVELLDNSVWFTRLVKENRLLFPLSTPDVVSKLIQHLRVYSSLTSAVVLIFRRPQIAAALKVVAEQAGSLKDVASPTAASVPDAVASNQRAEHRETGDVVVGLSATLLASNRAWRRRRAMVHVCYFAWGLGLLAIHVKATVRSKQEVQGCSLASASWFVSGYACSVYDYNCYRHGTTGPDETSWSQLDPDTLAFFTITHCPELKMPRRFQIFRNLLVLQMYNVTVVEWGKESAITPTSHALLTAVAIVRTNMTDIFDGMLQGLPDKFQSVQITHTNLTALPPDLHIKWHALTTLCVEHSLLREFPETLLSLPVRDLSLHGNLIETAPGLSRSHQQYFSFVMSANPLVSLPDSLGAGATFVFFSAEHTLLETLPSWVRTSVSRSAFLFGTPYCENQTTKEATACVVRDDSVDGRVSTAVFDATYPLRRAS